MNYAIYHIKYLQYLPPNNYTTDCNVTNHEVAAYTETMELITIVGTAGIILTSTQLIPQVVKAY